VNDELLSFQNPCPLADLQDTHEIAGMAVSLSQARTYPGSQGADDDRANTSRLPSHSPNMVYQEAASTKRRKTARANIRRQKAAEKESCYQSAVSKRPRAHIQFF